MAKLQAAIERSLSRALELSADGVVRIDLPSTWPLVGALAERIRQGVDRRLRIGVLRPFSVKSFGRLGSDVSDDPTKITGWRNSRRRVGELIVCGRADGRNSAGLRDFARVVRRKDVIEAWVELEGDIAATKSGKPEIARLVSAMFEECARGRIDGVALNEYLTASAEVTSRNIDSVFAEMWRARLIPDDQVLDRGASARRLDLNLSVLARLEAEEEREIRARLRQASEGGGGGGRKANSARAALAFMKSGAREDLSGARLSDIVEILGQKIVTPAPERAHEFTELLDQMEREPGVCVEALKDLSNRWDLDDPDLGLVEVDAALRDGRSRYRIVLSPTTEKVGGDDGTRDVLHSPWVGDREDSAAQTLIAWRDQETPEPYDGGSGWKKRTAAEFEQVLNVDSEADVALLREPLKRFIAARARLKAFEPWLSENALELLILKKDARGAVSEYLQCWEVLIRTALEGKPPVAIVRLLQFLDASWGPSLEEPKWTVLGPLHAYRLDPLWRIAGEAATAIEERRPTRLGEAVAWLRERCFPAYPAVYAGEPAMHPSKPESQPIYLYAAQDHLPRAEEGHGIGRIVDCLRGFAPQLDEGFVVLLIDPPPGAAIGAEIRRLISKGQGRTSILVVSTRHDANPLDEADGDVRYIGRFDGLQSFVERANVAAHIVVRFTGQPKGSVAARHGWSATRGAFLAPHLEIALDPLAGEELRPVAEVKIEPRQSNEVVCLTHELYRKQTGSTPKHFQFRPMLPREEIESLKLLSRRTDWLVVAAPGPMGLATPARINSHLSFVGRESFGPFGLYVYDTAQLFSVRRFVEESLRNVPVVIGAEKLTDCLTELAKQSGAAILSMGRDGVDSHQASLVALKLAQIGDNGEYLDIVLRVDDLGWTRIWIGEGRRCDFLVVRIAVDDRVEPRIIIRAVESKSDQDSTPIMPARSTMVEAASQIETTLSALRDVILTTLPTLDQDVRFSTFVEHLMAAALASDPNFEDLGSLKRAITTLNAFSSRMLVGESIKFEGLAVVTQASTNADRVATTEMTADGTKLTFVRATAKDLSTLFGEGIADPGVQGRGEATVSRPEAVRSAGEDREIATTTVRPPMETAREDGVGVEVVGGAAILREPSEEKPRDAEVEWGERVARDLIQICKRHGIPVAEGGPSRVLLGPSLLSVSVRLKIGAQLSSIERRLEDLMRDIGLGDRTREVSVVNDVEPSTVRFLIPRTDREFPDLPADAIPVERNGGYLPIRIGKTLEGQDFISPVESWPHMLVAGTTGSGKTTFIRATLLQLARFAGGSAQIILVDGKGDTDYLNLVPRNRFVREFPEPLLGHERILEICDWAVTEMDRRRQLLHRIAGSGEDKRAVKWPDLFRAELKAGKEPKVSPVVIVIDEFADLMHAGRASSEEFLSKVQRIAQVGRSRMIHLILATQRPDRETIRGAIKTNLDARVVLRLPTAADSMTVLGRGGAERLLKHGDMIFELSGTVTRLQGYRA